MSRFARNGHPLAALAAALAALLAAACGGGEARLTKAQYENHVRALYGEVSAAFQATRGISGTALAEQIETASMELRIASQQLDGRWEPPREIEEHNEELAEGMLAYSAELHDLGQALSGGKRSALARFNRGIPQNDAIERMAEAAEEMKFMGYDLGAIADE